MTNKRIVSDYGEFAARRRAQRKAEQAQQLAKQPPKPIAPKRKEIKAPNLDWEPMKDKKIKPYDFINWNDGSTDVHSLAVAKGLLDEHMQLIVMPTGSGKTAVTIAAIGKLQELTQRKVRFVITAPAATIQGRGWVNTIAAWNTAHPDNTLEPVLVTTIDRFASAGQHGKTMVRIMEALGDNGLIITDEVHKYKNATSKRSKQLQKFSMFKRISLSATPITNNAIYDMMSYLIMAGFYEHKTEFMRTSGLNNFVGKHGRLLVYNEDGSVNTLLWPYYETVIEQMAAITYRPTVDVSLLDMPDVKSRIYQMEHSAQLEADMRSLSKVYNQRKFDSFTDFYMEVVERLYGDESRLDLLMELVQEPGVRQPLIFYTNTVVLDKICQRFKDANIEYQIVAGGYDFSEVDLEHDGPLLVQYQSGAEGIEMKHSNRSIFYQNQHSYNTLHQARGRNVRRGMQHDVEHYYIIADNYIDQEIFDRVMKREEISGLVIEEIVKTAMKY